MKLPFTVEQFLHVFKQYNSIVFPMQVVFYLLAITAVIFAYRHTSSSGTITSSILAFFWLWMGVVYHITFFSTINTAAYLFGGVFVLQSILFLYFHFSTKKLSFAFHRNIYGITGATLIVFALVIYPLIGMYSGHQYPAAPTFGVPCPTTIFTFGLLLWTEGKCPVSILVIPFLWSLLGFSAVVYLGMLEDISLLIASLVATTMILIRNSHYHQTGLAI
jgi:hypothetical protein